MIEFRHVDKHYDTPSARKVLLRNFSMVVPSGAKVALMGRNGAGKSTMIGMISGTVSPNAGSIRREGTMSWPMGFSGSFAADITGRQNALFVARIYGVDAAALLGFVEDFAELGGFFDMPVRSYSSGMRARLAFGLSMGLGFDWYLVDEVTAVGDSSFRKKSLEMFRDRLSDSGLIMVSHSMQTLRDYCTSGIVLEAGECTYFPDLEEAIRQHEENMSQAFAAAGQELAHDAVSIVREAKRHFRNSDYAHAEEILMRAPTSEKNNLDILSLYADVMQRQGDQESAISLLDKIIETSAEPDFLRRRGRLFLLQEDYPRAEEDLRRAIKSDPESADISYDLARTLYKAGKLEEAIVFMERTVDLRPGAADAHRMLGKMISEQGKIDKAVSHYQEAARLLPNNIEFSIQYARLLAKAGNVQEASKVYNDILSKDAGNSKVIEDLRVLKVIDPQVKKENT